MRKVLSWGVTAFTAVVGIGSSIVNASPILQGQLINVRVGNGSSNPTGAALPVALDVYNVSYSLSGIPLP